MYQIFEFSKLNWWDMWGPNALLYVEFPNLVGINTHKMEIRIVLRFFLILLAIHQVCLPILFDNIWAWTVIKPCLMFSLIRVNKCLNFIDNNNSSVPSHSFYYSWIANDTGHWPHEHNMSRKYRTNRFRAPISKSMTFKFKIKWKRLSFANANAICGQNI